jgi:2-C-methyl-D-erythritol 4-phosphate cytidylyltransferase
MQGQRMNTQVQQAKAVILAGGVGTRVGLGIPKQFLKVAGKSLIEHTIGVFETSHHISEIVIMMNPEWINEVEEIVGRAHFTKVKTILPGGSTRNETTQLALACFADDDIVLFHDAVRPLVDEQIIGNCVNLLRTYQAIDVVIPSADTLVIVDESGIIQDIPPRSNFRRGQTPQGFNAGVLKSAYEIANQDVNFQATDDCSVVLKYRPDVKIATVLGSEYNMKVTEPIDLFLVDKLFQVSSLELDTRTDDERKKALAGKVAVIFGGSEGIGSALADSLIENGVEVRSFSRNTTGTDVADLAKVTAALESTYSELSRIDFVVNSAGILNIGKIAEQPLAEIEATIAINYVGAVNVARASHKFLAETNGHLLLFTSSSHTRGRSDYSIYSSTKAAVVNLGQALADEWAPDSISVNVVNPERTSTPMRTKAFGDEDPTSLLTAADVAQSCLDVLTTKTTGHVIDVRISGKSS